MPQSRREIFLLTVKGERARPGLTAALAETMGKHDVTVLDIGQAGAFRRPPAATPACTERSSKQMTEKPRRRDPRHAVARDAD
jgi:hypothetical protein